MDEGRVLLGNIKYRWLNSIMLGNKNYNLLVVSDYWLTESRPNQRDFELPEKANFIYYRNISTWIGNTLKTLPSVIYDNNILCIILFKYGTKIIYFKKTCER